MNISNLTDAINHSNAYNDLVNGSVQDAVTHYYGDQIGAEWFYFFIFFILILIAYLKSGNMALPTLITLLFFGVGWIYLPQEARMVLGLITGVVFAILAYKIWSSRGS